MDSFVDAEARFKHLSAKSALAAKIIRELLDTGREIPDIFELQIASIECDSEEVLKSIKTLTVQLEQGTVSEADLRKLPIEQYSDSCRDLFHALGKWLDCGRVHLNIDKNVLKSVQKAMTVASNSFETLASSVDRSTTRLEHEPILKAQSPKTEPRIAEHELPTRSENETERDVKVERDTEIVSQTSLATTGIDHNSVSQVADTELDKVKKQMADMKSSYETQLSYLRQEIERLRNDNAQLRAEQRRQNND